MGTSGNQIFRQMHETGGGLKIFYSGFQAHLYGRLGYLFVRNTLYKLVYDIVKPVKPSNDLTIKEKMWLAGTVGGIAAFLTSPFELISIRQTLDTQIPKAWRRNYGEPFSAFESLKKGTGLWHGASINVLRHVLLNISLTAPFDWLHERLWIIFGDYGHVKPLSLAFAALVASVVTLPVDNLRTKWMQRHYDPTRNRINASTPLEYAKLTYLVEGHLFSPWVGFYTYFTYMLLYSALTVGITDSITTGIKRRKGLENWQI